MADTSGPAFPTNNGEGVFNSSGMSLRDYFAASAMQPLLTDPLIYKLADKRGMRASDLVGGLSYEFADAMLDARNG